jgi:diguanylate cyclase (GGDEF)-like protein
MESEFGIVRRGSSPLWRAAGFVLLYNGLFFLWLLFKPGSHAFFAAIDNVAQFSGWLLVLPLCLGGLPARLRPGANSTVATTGAGRPRSWAPVLLGTGILSITIGQMIYTYYEQILHYSTAPFPSWADACFLATYPFLLIGILLLPTQRLPLVLRTRIFLDGLMIMVAMVTFSWYFILGPTVLEGADTLLGQIVGVAYPLADLLLIFCLLLLSAHFGDPRLRRVVVILWLALTDIVVTDTIFDYQTLHNAYHTGGLLDVGWPLGYMLVGLAAYALRLAGRERVRSDDTPAAAPGERQGAVIKDVRGERVARTSVWHVLLPYAVVPAIGSLLLFSLLATGNHSVEPGVYAGSAILIALVLLRQVLALLENRRLYGSLHDMYSQLETNNSALAEANGRLQALATTDALTDVPNHRAMIAAIDQELARARRFNRPCSILFFDLDHFKALNDGYGHAAGDAVLREFATLIRSTLRGIDTLGRWGGEEFVALLPETNPVTALYAAERLRVVVAANAFGPGGGVQLTCSIGMAAYPRDGEERADLVEAADRAMYAAKALGRNQIRDAVDAAVMALQSDLQHSTSREDAALQGTVEALAALVQVRDHYTGEHTFAVGALAMRMAEAIGLSSGEARMIGLAGRLHDIGKIGVPDTVLQKADPLTEDEWVLMRKHPTVGADVVSRVPALRVLAPLIRAHHERWDGHGYPDGLAGKAIPLGARIIALTDAYGAMTTDRPYRRARDASWALEELRRGAGTQFDPSLVGVLEHLLVSEPETNREESSLALGVPGWTTRQM